MRTRVLTPTAVTATLVLVALGAPGAHAAARNAAEFFARNPHGTVSCAIYSGYAGATTAFCESVSSKREAKTSLSASGLVSVCVSHNPRSNACNLGNAGEGSPTLGYGRRVTVGRFRCSVLRAGVKCVVIASGKGFLFSSKKTAAVGGARVRRVSSSR